MVNRRVTGFLTQDIGLLLLLTCIFIGALTVGNASSDMFIESLVMLIGVFLAILFAGYKLTSLAVVSSGFQIIVYTAYRLFLAYSSYGRIPLVCYIWILLPLTSVGAMLLFIKGNKDTERENERLAKQVEDYVMINALTGLYNLRSLYNDLKKQIAYAERNKVSLSLMIIELRDEAELRNILSRTNYEAVIQRLAFLVGESIRLEDRIYSIDNKGTIAILLTCNKEGSDFVSKRIRQKLSEQNAFEQVKNRSIRVEVRIACLEYDKEVYGDDIIQYKQKVESELQYDV
ncbi:GGDEF domain-containing protein [Anaeromicropila herbilytica]|uniref:Diguanylate cyclase n=1 Tax=Anaeromicropila herbilytica TaxID=2785025 RepID=A0A7R7EJJ2_9FIRM|nr:GGDEF domain-containing protein [Anaeromicropila herbilytica]BCN29938.1 diguanylate cyclase [Anaeromicropila herbilytica]